MDSSTVVADIYDLPAEHKDFRDTIRQIVTEKVGGLKQAIDDPRFPQVTYRRGAAGWPEAVLRGTGIRAQTIVVAHQTWGMAPAEIAADYERDPLLHTAKALVARGVISGAEVMDLYDRTARSVRNCWGIFRVAVARPPVTSVITSN